MMEQKASFSIRTKSTRELPSAADVLLNIGGGNDAQLRPSVGGPASAVAAYDLIATDDQQLTNAARRYFKPQPIATMSMILVTGLHLVGGIPQWCDPITLTFAAHRRLLRGLRLRQK